MPLTAKGAEIMANLTKEYGAEKAKEVFCAGKNKGTFTGVDSDAPDPTIEDVMYRMDLLAQRMDRFKAPK